MKSERFQELYSMRGIDGQIPLSYKPSYATSSYKPVANGLTEAEDKEVCNEWKYLGGSSCWFDAFMRLWRRAEAGY